MKNWRILQIKHRNIDANAANEKERARTYARTHARSAIVECRQLQKREENKKTICIWKRHWNLMHIEKKKKKKKNSPLERKSKGNEEPSRNSMNMIHFSKFAFSPKSDHAIYRSLFHSAMFLGEFDTISRYWCFTFCPAVSLEFLKSCFSFLFVSFFLRHSFFCRFCLLVVLQIDWLFHSNSAWNCIQKNLDLSKFWPKQQQCYLHF